jgi:tetratricopeptide (TPR) repeat protein
MLKLFRRRARKTRQAADAARDAAEWAQAASLYKKYLSKWPNGRNAAIWIQLGNVSKEAGQHVQARAAYQRAIALAPTDAEPQFQLGDLFKRMGAPGKSRAAYLQALRLNPAFAAARNALAITARAADAAYDAPPCEGLAAADRERDLKHWDRAAVLYEAHLLQADHANDASIWVQLGHMRKEAGHKDQALKAYMKSLELRPDIADTHLQIGHLYKISGEIQSAILCYQKALDIDPTLEDAQTELDRLATPLNSSVQQRDTPAPKPGAPAAAR